MELTGKVAVVTGGASGIGRALCERFVAEGAKVVVSDVDAGGAVAVAQLIGALAIPANVAVEAEVKALVEHATAEFGRIDLFCSNAGIMVEGGENTLDADWKRIIDINVLAHIYAARAVIPAMLARGEGYILNTVSAAGLLSQIGSAPYSVTKHAALAFSEWLSITYGDRGLRVSALCPQGVRTNMLKVDDPGAGKFLVEGSLSAERVAADVVAGLRDERFLILPHPEVADYFLRKATDYDRWIRGMRRLQARMIPLQ